MNIGPIIIRPLPDVGRLRAQEAAERQEATVFDHAGSIRHLFEPEHNSLRGHLTTGYNNQLRMAAT